jgi:arabinogalactan oligomer/maltooligosaccharide transport system permease protein
VYVDETSAIKIQGINMAFMGRASIVYDEATDTLTNRDTGEVFTVCTVGNSEVFCNASGARAFSQGWLQHVGLANYQRLFTTSSLSNQFLGALGWTLVFAFFSVFLSFALGFFLAMVFNDPRVKFRKFIRSFLLLPYAVPAFISILVWRNFYNRDFGLINDIIRPIFGMAPNWLGDPNLAKFAVLLTNMWLGFPYMFIVCTGALQNIPVDVNEAAEIDGAGGWRRTLQITTPLLLISVAPLLVSAFAFNFNNFNVIQLLTEGAPFQPGQFTRGSTDILISMIYRTAFGGSGADFGFASALSVGLFILTAVIATIQFRATKRFEDYM